MKSERTFGVGDDVVHIRLAEVEKVSQQLIHRSLKRGRSIAQAEGHHYELEVTSCDAERRLLHVVGV